MQNVEKISVTMTTDMLRTIRASVEAGEYASGRAEDHDGEPPSQA